MKLVIVAGMHRCGTSATAGLISHFGVSPGDHLQPGDANNPKGYFEDRRIVKLHDIFLAKIDSSWDNVKPFPEGWTKCPAAKELQQSVMQLIEEQSRSHDSWIIKDPRICRLLPIWIDAASEMGAQPVFVIPFRSPDACIASLSKRNGFSTEHASLLWLIHLRDAEKFSYGHPRVFMQYESLLTDWKPALMNIRKELAIELAWSDENAKSGAAFISAELNHTPLAPTTNVTPALSIARDIFAGLSSETPVSDPSSIVASRTDQINDLIFQFSSDQRFVNEKNNRDSTTGANAPTAPPSFTATPILLNPRLLSDRQKYQMAMASLQSGRLPEAAEVLIDLASQDTPLWEAYNQLGVIAIDQQDFDAARNLLEVAILKAGTSTISTLLLSQIELAARNHERALELICSFLVTHPNDQDALVVSREILEASSTISHTTWSRLVSGLCNRATYLPSNSPTHSGNNVSRPGSPPPVANGTFSLMALLANNPNLKNHFLWGMNIWPKNTPKLLHMGCGENVLPNFTNVDFLPIDFRVTEWNLLSYWPDEIESQLEGIYSEDVMEHFFLPEQLYILCSANRALTNASVFRALMPSIQSLISIASIEKGPNRDRALEFMRASYGVTTPYDAINYGLRFSGHRWLHNHESFSTLARESGFEYHPTSCSESKNSKFCAINIRNESNSLSFAADLIKKKHIRYLRILPSKILNASPIEAVDAETSMYEATNDDPKIIFHLENNLIADQIVLLNFRSVNTSQFFEHNYSKVYFSTSESQTWKLDATLRSAPYMNIVTGQQLRLKVGNQHELRWLRFDPSECAGDFFTVGPLEIFYFDIEESIAEGN